MHIRFVPPLLCAAAIAFACRPGVRPSLAGVVPSHRPAADSAGIAGTLGVSTTDGVRFAFHVVNETAERVEVRFPSGQTRDFVVLDAAGKEVWRWSRGRLFTQTVQNKFLSGRDTTVYESRWQPTRPGHYTAVGTLRSGNFPLERRASFEVQPSTVAALEGGESEEQP